jgi:hypothetical protein
MSRIGVYILAFGFFVTALSFAIDALVVTDQERMEEFVKAVTGQVSDDRIDNALQYADPERLEVDLVQASRMRHYGSGNLAELRPTARKALAPLAGNNLRLIQKSISVDGNSARVALRVRTEAGLANTVFDLRRYEEDWLLRRVTVN